jgi:hypothetical protein
LLALAVIRQIRFRRPSYLEDDLITQSLEHIYLNASQINALSSNELQTLTHALSQAENDSFYVMVEAIRQRRPAERDHLIHALDVLENRSSTEQLLFGFLLIEKAKDVRDTKALTDLAAEKIARAQELARMGMEALQGLSHQLEGLWAKDVYFESLINAGLCTETLAGRHELWLTRVQDYLGQLPSTSRTLCTVYSAKGLGSTNVGLDIARKIFDATEPGSPCSGILVFAHDLAFYNKRFIEKQQIDPTTYYAQKDVKAEILQSLKKWYAVKEKPYGYQRSLSNDRLVSVLLFLGYPTDAFKALVRSHCSPSVWCIKKMIPRKGLHQHVRKAMPQKEAKPQLNYLR